MANRLLISLRLLFWQSEVLQLVLKLERITWWARSWPRGRWADPWRSPSYSPATELKQKKTLLVVKDFYHLKEKLLQLFAVTFVFLWHWLPTQSPVLLTFLCLEILQYCTKQIGIRKTSAYRAPLLRSWGPHWASPKPSSSGWGQGRGLRPHNPPQRPTKVHWLKSSLVSHEIMVKFITTWKRR